MKSSEYDRSLCTVVSVKSMSPIAGADKVELAVVNGWQCVVAKKEGIKAGDMALYYSIDAIPDLSDPNAALIKKRGGRIKTIKLRGIISQGLLAPLSWMESRGHDVSNLAVGDDVTEAMGVTKYIREEEIEQYFSPQSIQSSDFEASAPFPSYVPKTDECRLQDKPQLLEYISNRDIVVTRKEDGSSATFVYNNGEFDICGRNYTWLKPSGASKNYFLIENKFKLRESMSALKRNIAIQGEIVGPKVNGNRLCLSDYQFRVFNIWDIDLCCYLSWTDVESVCAELNIPTVPVIFRGNSTELNLSVVDFLSMAEDQYYTTKALGEGIVVKTDDCNRRVSFKVISNKYLLKHNM